MKKAVRRLLCAMFVLTLFISAIPAAQITAEAKQAIEYYVTVDQTNQITTVFRISDSTVVRQMLCTTGMNGATPNGTYSMPSNATAMDRTEWYHFKGFRCYAKYPTRVFKGVLFHSITYNKKNETTMARSAIEEYGRPASHGCIRLLVEDSKWIQEHCPIGTKVIIYESGILDRNLWNVLFQEHYTEDSGMTYEEFLGGAITRYSNRENVYKLQYRLHELGFFNGTVNGIWGDDTTESLLLAQVASGSTITGNVSSDFMALLESDDAPVIPGYDFSTCMHEPGIRLLQQGLKKLGLFEGDIDGVFDFEVSEAVATFQNCYGYTQTGTPSVIEQEAIQYEADRVTAICGEDAKATVVSDTVQTATVSYDKSVRLREKPDTDSHEITTVKPGTTMLFLATNDVWSQVQLGSKVGFMKNKYLTMGSYTVSYLTYTGSAGQYQIGCSITDKQNGASQPASSFKSYHNELNSKKKSAVKSAKEVASTNLESYASLSSDTMTVNTGSDGVTLNLRADASTEAEVLTALPNGTKVETIYQSGDWTKVKFNETTGFVLSQYLSAVTRDTSLFLSYVPRDVTIVTPEGFGYVYADADKKSQKIGYVTTGSVVSAYASDNGFTYIRYYNGVENTYGFIKNEVLAGEQFDYSAADLEDDPDEGDDVVMYAYIIDSVPAAPVYTSADTGSAVLGTIGSGTKVTVIEADESSNWVLIEYNGVKGYTDNSMLRFDTDTI